MPKDIRDRAILNPAAGTARGSIEDRRQEALLKTGALQNAILNSANILSIATDKKGVIQIFNIGAERMLGYTAADVLNKITPADISDPEEVLVRAKALSAEMATPIRPGFEALVFKASRGIEDIYELTYVRKDGSRLPAVVSVTALRDPQGAVIGYLLIGTENIARQRAEARLAYQARLLATVSDAIIASDEHYLLTAWNAAAEALYGWKAEEVLGRNSVEILRTEYPGADPEAMRRQITEAGGWRGEATKLRKDGTRIPVEVASIVLYDAAHRVSGYVDVNRDVTERKQAEAALARHAEALRRSNAELVQFAYVASHELQEPLCMVTSYLQLIERRYKGQLDANADEFIAFAVDGAERMKTLINDLLAYSRVGTRGKELQPTDCNAALEQAKRNLQVAIRESGAAISSSTLPTVFADEAQLVQLFQNLLANAIKFRTEKCPEISITGVAQDGEWRFAVRDNGIGIEPQFSERIFIIFQRLHRRDEYAGTGIGLAICKKIVERHGGRIWVESQPGVGSTFYFTLRPESRPVENHASNGDTTGHPDEHYPLTENPGSNL